MSGLVRRALLLASAACTLAACAAGDGGRGAPESIFYYAGGQRARQSVRAHARRIAVLAPQAFTLDSAGRLHGLVDPWLERFARETGMRLMPVVVNQDFDDRALHALLTDTAARRRATEAVAGVCRAGRYWAVQLDFEHVREADRDRLTTWYADAARAVRVAGCQASIAIVPRVPPAGPPADAPPTAGPSEPTGYERWMQAHWRGGYDVAALARASDFVTLMAYAQHTRQTPPGPVAGMPWTVRVLDDALRDVPPGKLSLGVPLWSVHWFARADTALPDQPVGSSARRLSWAQAVALARRHDVPLRWDDSQGATYAYFENGGTFEWLYLEGVRGFEARLRLVRQRGLRGFSAWVLGVEDQRIWDALPERRGGA